jgi:ankyrin repeat protein
MDYEYELQHYDPAELLYKAIKNDNFATVKYVLDQFPELINTPYDRELSYLHVALKARRSIKMIQYLIELGADVNAGGTFTPLMVAATTHNANAAELLLHHGADPSRLPVLHKFVSYNINGIVHKLLDAGANPNLRDADGRTPLSVAVREGPYLQTMRLLVDYGADPNIPDTYGGTPLHDACEVGLPDVINFLLSAGANVNAVDAHNRTPLQYALWTTLIRGSLAEVVTLLLNAGANPVAVDAEGNSVLDYANRLRHPRITALITEAIRQYRIRERVQAAFVAQESGLPTDIARNIGTFLGGRRSKPKVRKSRSKQSKRKFNTTAASTVRRK